MKSLYKLKNIVFNYDNNSFINDLNLEIAESEITSVIGPNGSGKTTLLNILSFLNFPFSGSIFFNDTELKEDNIKRFRNKIGYVQQNPYLFRGTVYKNIEIGLKLNNINSQKRVYKIKKILSLLKIEHLTDRPANSLSSGEARKLALGQIIVLNPSVLIMDEPFSNLDKNSVTELEELIIFLNKELNKTVIFTTHDKIQAQKISSSIFSLIKGRVFSNHFVNLYKGKFDESINRFDTGKQLISIYESKKNAEYVFIDPKQIVLSLEELDSSMQNSFHGRVIEISEGDYNVKLNIDIGENIQAIITHQAFNELKLSINMYVWVSFKSASIMIF